jgi:MtN3 and saliva related transmembrane protein
VIPAESVTVVGLVAGACTTIAFVPQTLRVWRLKRAEEISLTTYLVLTVGMLVWVTYGVLISSWPVIIANGVTVSLTTTILVLRVRWGGQPREAGA